MADRTKHACDRTTGYCGCGPFRRHDDGRRSLGRSQPRSPPRHGRAQRHARQLQRWRRLPGPGRGHRRRPRHGGGRRRHRRCGRREHPAASAQPTSPPKTEQARILPVIRGLAGGRLARLGRYAPRRDDGSGARCRRRHRQRRLCAGLRPRGRAAGRRARLPGRADAHARHAGRHVRPGPLRRCRGRRDARTWPSGSRPPNAPASPATGSRSTPASASPRPPAVDGAAAPPAGTWLRSAARSSSASHASRSSARSPGEAGPAPPLPGSLAAGLFALSRGAAILRVHDVAETMQAIKVWQALTA